MANKKKKKGDVYERELAHYIAEKTGMRDIQRAPLSGGGFVGKFMGGADLLGTPGLFIEAKRVEKLNFHEALRQAEHNKEKTKSPEAPIVINRMNRMTTGQSLCLIRLDDLLTFYNAYLREEGVTKPTPPDGGGFRHQR